MNINYGSYGGIHLEKIVYEPIGYVRSPYKGMGEGPIQPRGGKGVRGTLEIFPGFVDGLKDLDGFSRIQVLFHMHLSEGFSLSVIPFLDTVKRGLFSTRSPRRPNPIGLSVVKLLRIDGNILHIEDIDMLDGTPVLDIKPYVPDFDRYENERIGWLTDRSHEVGRARDDGRFR